MCIAGTPGRELSYASIHNSLVYDILLIMRLHLLWRSRVYVLKCHILPTVATVFCNADILDCWLQATNIGNVGLDGLRVAGDAHNCTGTFIAVNNTVLCLVSRVLSAEHFWYGGDVGLHVPFNVTPRGRVPFLELLPPSYFTVNLTAVTGFIAVPPVLNMSVINSTVSPMAVYQPGEAGSV